MYIRCVFYDKELKRGRRKNKAVERPSIRHVCYYIEAAKFIWRGASF